MVQAIFLPHFDTEIGGHLGFEHFLHADSSKFLYVHKTYVLSLLPLKYCPLQLFLGQTIFLLVFFL